MAPHMVDTIQTPLFMLNSRFDLWQLENIFQSPWDTVAEEHGVVQYGESFIEQLAPVAESSKSPADLYTCPISPAALTEPTD